MIGLPSYPGLPLYPGCVEGLSESNTGLQSIGERDIVIRGVGILSDEVVQVNLVVLEFRWIGWQWSRRCPSPPLPSPPHNRGLDHVIIL